MSGWDPAGGRRLFLREIALIVGIVAVGFLAWALSPRPADDDAFAAALADPRVQVTTGPVVEIRPAERPPSGGLVFYPGARINREGYVATLAPIVAETDLLVLIPRMPLNLPLLDRSRAADLMAAHPEIERWWVGGHAQGGSMAASWLGEQPVGVVEGLILWASHAAFASGLDTRTELDVLTVYGSRDALMPPLTVEGRRELLPPETVFVEIEGMNHSSFGRYGEHNRDNPATISPDGAQAALTAAHVDFFANTVDPPLRD